MKILPSIRTLLPALVALLVPFAVNAATLQVIEGEITVNQGAGFQPVVGLAELKPGDVIMAGRNGKANLVFADGTAVPLQEGAIITVSDNAPPADSPPVDAAVTGGGLSSTQILTGAAVAGGVVGVIAALSSGSSGSSKAASP